VEQVNDDTDARGGAERPPHEHVWGDYYVCVICQATLEEICNEGEPIDKTLASLAAMKNADGTIQFRCGKRCGTQWASLLCRMPKGHEGACGAAP
jgi:hypothetical protein